MDIQVYSSKEKASVTVDGEVVSNFLNEVRCLQFKIYTLLSVSSIYGPVAKQADHKSTVETRILNNYPAKSSGISSSSLRPRRLKSDDIPPD